MSVITHESLSFTGISGNEPTLRYLANGTAVTNLSLCVDRLTSRDAEGKMQTSPTWYGVPVFGPAAEAINARCKKGSVVQVRDAVPSIRTYTDKDGNVQSRMEAIHGFVVVVGNGKQVDTDGFPTE